MNIYTGYFGKLRKFPENLIPIAICASLPSWYTGLSYKALAPTFETYNAWKVEHNEEKFRQLYANTTLRYLSGEGLYNDLLTFAKRNIKNFDTNITDICLICYEKATDFCHRHIVREFLLDSGIYCHEWNEVIGEMNVEIREQSDDKGVISAINLHEIMAKYEGRVECHDYFADNQHIINLESDFITRDTK